MIVTASYGENYFSQQYHKHDFSASLSEECHPHEDARACHDRLTQMCRSLVAGQIEMFKHEVEAQRVADAQAAQQY